MTETEYINVKHLGHIQSAIECLRHVTSQVSDVIDDDEFKKVMNYFSKWELKLFDKIKTNN